MLLQEARPIRILKVIMLNIRASRVSSDVNLMSTDLMNALLATMKENYKDIDGHADRPSRDDYVTFIQDVLGELSIYLPSYRKLDPFFNDAALFPQPASSIYVSLHQYSLNLTATASQKSLITFMYNILERAALDDSQSVVQEQLIAALDDVQATAIEVDDTPLQLQLFLLQNVFPAYVELMCTEYGRWIVIPVLSAIQHAYQVTLPSITNINVDESTICAPREPRQTERLTRTDEIESFLASTISLLVSFHHALKSLTKAITRWERDPHVAEDLFLLITTLAKLLQPINSLHRLGDVRISDQARCLLHQTFQAFFFFNHVFTGLDEQLLSSQDLTIFPPGSPDRWPDISVAAGPVSAFARSELLDALETGWTAVAGRGVYVNKRNGSKEVLAAKSRDDDLRREIERTGVEWAQWTIWTACKTWHHEWLMVDGMEVGQPGHLNGRAEEDWRLFVL